MLHKDVWLSQYFEGDAYNYKPPFTDADLPHGFIFSKTPAEDKQTIKILGKQRFKHVETLVQFEQKEAVEPFNTYFKIRLSQDQDKTSVMDIAREAFTSSRLFQDPNISNIIAGNIKADWVGNFYNGDRGDMMIIAEDQGRVMGFLLLIGDVIDLIAVSQQDYKKGVASAMIAFVNKQGRLLRAGTQIINQPSIALYQKCGFVKAHETYVFHRHK